MLAERLETESLDRGYRGTSRTIDKMHLLVARGKLDPSIHKIATWIRLSVPQDYRGSTKETAQAIFDWVRRNGIFQRDPFQIERIEHPIVSMQAVIEARRKGAHRGRGLFVGDCDMYSIWVAVLGGLLGFQYAFETSKSDPRRPDEFSHVWSALLVGNEWLPLDASTPGAKPGWRPPVPPDRITRWAEKPIEETMSGLNGHYRGNGNGMGCPPGWNGHGRGRGMGDDENGQEYVAADEYGYGVPQDIDPKTPEFLDVDPGRLDTLVPDEPQIPLAEMEPGVESIRKVPMPGAGDRPSFTQGDENFNTGPRYTRKRPYYWVKKLTYPIDSKWNRISQDDGHLAAGGQQEYYRVYKSDVPSMDVDVVSGTTLRVNREGGHMNIQRRNGDMAIMRPRRTPAGMGQDTTTQAATVQQASTSVWDTITKTITQALPATATALVNKTQAYYAEKLAKATNAVAGKQIVSPTTYTGGTPWYFSLWTLLGALAIGGGAIYVATRPRRRSGRYRRR